MEIDVQHFLESEPDDSSIIQQYGYIRNYLDMKCNEHGIKTSWLLDRERRVEFIANGGFLYNTNIFNEDKMGLILNIKEPYVIWRTVEETFKYSHEINPNINTIIFDFHFVPNKISGDCIFLYYTM